MHGMDIQTSSHKTHAHVWFGTACHVTHPVPPLLQAYKTYQLGGKLNELLYSPALYGVDLSGKVCNVGSTRGCSLHVAAQLRHGVVGSLVAYSQTHS